MEYKSFKDGEGKVILQINVGRHGTCYLDLTTSLKDTVENTKNWLFANLNENDIQQLIPLTKQEKQKALDLVEKGMIDSVIKDKSWEHIKLFLLESLKSEE